VILASTISHGGVTALTANLLADGAGAGPAGPGGLMGSLPLLIIMFGIFYFLLIRPQQKRQKELQDWLKTLKKDDEVVTTGGLWGKVKGVSDNSPYVTLELQEKVRVRVLRSHIASKAPGNNETAAEAAKNP
jgi:preprotein translocase subunit YajC